MGQLPREVGPDPDGVVLRLPEVPADVNPNALAQAVGEEQHREAGHPKEDDEGLELEALHAADAPDDLRQYADDEQVAANEEDSKGGAEHRPGGIDVDLGGAGPHVGEHQDE